jgi:hypothetical protein
VVEQQHRAGGAGLQAFRFDVGLEVDDDAFVADADAEALQASVPAAGLGEEVVELVAVHVGHALRSTGGVVALVAAEQHDLGAVVLAAQQPRLVLLAERAPVVVVAVRPGLGFEAPAPVALALEPAPWP